MKLWRRILAHCQHKAKDEDGAIAVEFVIAFPLLFSIFLLAVDTGVTQMRQVFLDRSVDIAVRQVRLGLVGEQESLAQRICAGTAMIPNCNSAITVEMQPIPTDTFAGLSDATQCVDRQEEITPAVTFNPGAGEQELMLIRVCVAADPFINMTGYISALPRDRFGKYFLVSHSVFVNEPR